MASCIPSVTVDETFDEAKTYLKTQATSDFLDKTDAEKEDAIKELTAKRSGITMKQVDEVAKELLKSAKRSNDVFETVYDDFTAIAAAAGNFEDISDDTKVQINLLEECFDLKQNTAM